MKTKTGNRFTVDSEIKEESMKQVSFSRFY